MFAWCPADMPGIPRELAEHELKIFPNAKPIKQSMRRYNPEKARAMGEEINRLLEAKFIREIKEATWLSPPVMVEKKDTKIYRMCIDFTALNKHCSKDYFPLPRIDQIIDSTAGCERLSFLDTYSGYNQIRLKVEDKDKIAFITPHGVYCYMTMPFGLKICGSHLSTVHADMREGADRSQHRSLNRRHRYQVHKSRQSAQRPARNFRQSRPLQHQAQPEEVLLRGAYRPAAGLPHL
jgi:hypothetical protein